MIVALVDNGSLAPAAHLNLRTVAAALSTRSGTPVHAVSWKHSDRIPPAAIEETPAWTLAPFVRAQVAQGHREFVLLLFFISGQGAIGAGLRLDLEKLQQECGGFEYRLADGLAVPGEVAAIATARIRATIASQSLRTPPVVVVDHGGPSPASAARRDDLAARIRTQLGSEIGLLATASMEGEHPPLLADRLRTAEFSGRDVVVSLLFLSPGRHAGPEGDVEEICRASPARCHLTGLIGTHPAIVDALAAALSAPPASALVNSFA